MPELIAHLCAVRTPRVARKRSFGWLDRPFGTAVSARAMVELFRMKLYHHLERERECYRDDPGYRARKLRAVLSTRRF